MEIINYNIIPHVSGCALKKYLDKNTASCWECLHKITRGRSLLINMMFAIDIRDEGGLLWPIIYAVLIFVMALLLSVRFLLCC